MFEKNSKLLVLRFSIEIWLELWFKECLKDTCIILHVLTLLLISDITSTFLHYSCLSSLSNILVGSNKGLLGIFS